MTDVTDGETGRGNVAGKEERNVGGCGWRGEAGGGRGVHGYGLKNNLKIHTAAAV